MRCVPTHASRRTPPHLAPVAGEVSLRRNHPARTQPARPGPAGTHEDAGLRRSREGGGGGALESGTPDPATFCGIAAAADIGGCRG